MRLLVFSNLFIAAAAALVTWDSYARLGRPGPPGPEVWLVFFATLVVYELDRLLGASEEDRVDASARHLWLRGHRRALWALTGAAAAGVAACLPFLPIRVTAVLVVLGALSLAYVAPVVRRGGRWHRLKDLAGLKAFLIAAVWAAATVLLPAFSRGAALLPTAWVTAERFLFVLAICLPFDVRDLARDRAAGIRTLPVALGVPATRAFGVALLVGYTGIVVAHYGVSASSPAFALVPTAALALGLVVAMDEHRPDTYYEVFVDGTLIVQGLLLLALAALARGGR